MADTQVKHHDYHIIDPSPWPFLGGISAFILAIGGISWMQYNKGNTDFTLFGIPAATNTATSRIAGMTKANIDPGSGVKIVQQSRGGDVPSPPSQPAPPVKSAY